MSQGADSINWSLWPEVTLQWPHEMATLGGGTYKQPQIARLRPPVPELICESVRSVETGAKTDGRTNGQTDKLDAKQLTCPVSSRHIHVRRATASICRRGARPGETNRRSDCVRNLAMACHLQNGRPIDSLPGPRDLLSD